MISQGFGAASLAASQCVVAGVDGHAIEPRAECCPTGEAVGLAKYRDERVLSGIERRLSISEHSQTDAEYPVLMGPHEFFKGGDVSGEVALNEVEVGSGPIGHDRNRTSLTKPKKNSPFS